MRIHCLFVLLLSTLAIGEETVPELLKRAQGEKDPPAAKAHLDKAVALAKANAEKTPESAATQYELGLALFELQDDFAATVATGRALKLKPGYADAHLLRAKLYGYSKDFEKALTHLDSAIQLQPDMVEAWYWRGCAFEELKRDAQALEAHLKTLALKEDHAEAHYKAGSLLSAQGDKSEALKHYKRAAELRPNWSDAQLNTGICLQNMWKFEEAMPYVERALKLEPDAYDIHHTRVQVASGLGDAKRVDEAIASLRKVRDAMPKEKQPSLFVRERFEVGEYRVIVANYYDMKGERAVRYSFNVRKPKEDQNQFRISLGSYDMTNEVAKSLGQMKPGERRYHLDGYFPKGEHRTYGFYNGEPAYPDVKKTVIEIIVGKKEEMSSSKPGEVIIKQ